MTMLTRGLLLGALALTPCLAAAQDAGAAQLRERVERVFMNRLRADLALTPAQTEQLGGVLTEWGARRRTLEQEEQAIRQAMDGQLRPGVAANADSVTRLVDRLLQNRIEYAQSFQGEMRALTPILNPVQRAQFVRLRDTLLQRVRDLQEQRPVQGRPVRP